MIRSFYSGLLDTTSVAKKRTRLIIRATVTAGVLVLLVWILPLDMMISAIGKIPALTWLIVISGFLLGHIISAYKWRLLLYAVNVRISGLEAVRAHGAGLFANLCLPSIVGGDIVRAGVVIRDRGEIEAITLGSLADRVNDTFALVLIAGISGLLVPGFAETQTGKILAGIAIFLMVMVFSGLFILRGIPARRLPERLRNTALRFGVALDSLLVSPGIALMGLFLSICIQGGFVLLNIYLAEAIGITAPVVLWFMAWPMAKLIALVPVSLGGIGVREAALAALMAPFGVEAALTVAQSLSWEVVLIFSGLLSGALVTFLPGYRKEEHLKYRGEQL